MNRLIHLLKNRFVAICETPIILLGNQKSGTSAISHLLANFGGLSKTVDIPALWPPAAVDIMRGKISFADIVRRYKSYFSTDIIKEPNMTFFADQVIERFPKAKYVFIIRDPRDNIRSLLNARHVPGHLQKIDSHFVPTRPQHRPFVDSSVWGGERENYIGVLAHKWCKAVDSYLRFQTRIILVKYEDFMSDKSGFIEKLATQLGVPKKNDISEKLDTQYQPRGKDRGVQWETFFGHDNLKRIERICGNRMKEFGYKIKAI